MHHFEEEMGELCHRRHGVAASSGSAALDGTFIALGVGPGDEVILPTFTIISSLLPMHKQPVFHERGLFAGESHPVAERLARYGFYLPSVLGLKPVQIERVSDAVCEVLGQ